MRWRLLSESISSRHSVGVLETKLYWLWAHFFLTTIYLLFLCHIRWNTCVHVYKTYIHITCTYFTNDCVCVWKCECVSEFLQLYASQINSVALEAKIYYQIKFLTEFIALSLAEHSFSHLLPSHLLYSILHNIRHGP